MAFLPAPTSRGHDDVAGGRSAKAEQRLHHDRQLDGGALLLIRRAALSLQPEDLEAADAERW